MAGKGKGGSFLGLIIGIVILGLVGWGLTNLYRTIDENNNSQKQADISLNEYVDSGKDLPVGEYVSLDVRFVAGPYATNTHTETTNYIFTATTAEDDYYVVMLEDNSIISVCTANKAEKEKLNKLAEWWNSVDGTPMTGEVVRLQGDLKEMGKSSDNEKELMDYYKSFLQSADVSPYDQRVHYVYLDTKTGRTSYIGWVIGGAAVLILILWFRSRSKKKKAAADAASSAQ